MKKVIFLAIAAAAALTACSKSEVIDSKYGNDMIGFENYLGRDAQTKAPIASSIETAGIYGFYTAGEKWDPSSTANLWANNTLSADGKVDVEKYWTNDEDYYTFLAYAPKDQTNLTIVDNQTSDPKVNYTVDNTITNQIDVLYAGAKDVQKKNITDKVDMTFKHALSRLTVNAKTADEQAFDFIVKKITLNGGFIESDVLTLNEGVWAKGGTPVAPTTPGTEATDDTPATLPVYATTYTFYDDENNEAILTTSNTEYAKRKVVDGETTTEVADNYLMMIPVNFTNQAAYLTVEYTTVYEKTESTINTATFPVNTNFEKGKAYAINLTFTKDVEKIEFNVTVAPWDESTTNADGTTDDHQKDENIQA